jgi:predicted nucleic acid-binding protein
MEDQSNKDTYDIFIMNSIYPDVRSIFAPLQPLDRIKDDCFIVLDTNVLLTPYTIGQEDLLDQCRKTFKPLSSQKRLIIPGQVAREFAKHRANKLAELYQQLSRKQVPSMNRGKYPLLSSLEHYMEIVRLEEEIDKKLEEYRQAYKKAIDVMLSHIQEWRWNDPVTLLYSEIFNEDTLVDPAIDKEALQKDLEHRLLYNIPPAYKDHAKDDNGIGDLLIWHTILEVGKSKKKSIIFVSGDEKADWCLRSEGRALYPRYELVDEFRRHSGGQTFHLVKFSYFLELFGASEKVVKQVQQEESLLQRQETIKKLEETREQREKNRRRRSFLQSQLADLHSQLEMDERRRNRRMKDLESARIECQRLLSLSSEKTHTGTPEEEELNTRIQKIEEEIQYLETQLAQHEMKRNSIISKIQETVSNLQETDSLLVNIPKDS